MDHRTHEKNTPLHKARNAFRRTSVAYSPREDRHLGGHLGAVVAFGAYTAAWGAAVAVRRTKLPKRPHPQDLLLTATAVFRLGRLLSKGSVTSPLRAPFTRYESATGPAEVSESPRGGGIRSTVGELATCPFCLSVWLTTTFAGAQLLWPRATRTVTGALTTLAVADTMQLGYDCLQQKNTE
ncbi:DUF1360 domain-containing protein [Streptomyces candidus]|uniref:DUF1360 domain-containing protein n=1 Tax=Streptomyces candidus TaxID=67283 RepID=A0A7X0HBJ7_9ACTN|nr:DUF1360 domain-containing protein [Streptomyces candidus]MBB6434574.1 hypothetical protein [Streptomyces candidus]GHH36218.1 hypothetical protein GCM10018773_10810 [Streptomyces candidus]